LVALPADERAAERLLSSRSVVSVSDPSTPARDVVIVDWLGRGGIAHTTEAWVTELRGLGRSPLVVTRSGRELDQSIPDRIGATGPGGAVAAHAAVVRAASKAVRAHAGCPVVLQGSVMPQLELRTASAAQAVGSLVVLVTHEAAITRKSPGALASFGRLVRQADIVIAHSKFVASQVSALAGRSDIQVIPLPLPLGLLGLLGRAPSVLPERREPVALHFGNLQRGYKGSSVVLQLAAEGVPGWRIALVGTGAPETTERLDAVSRFLEPAELVATVADVDAIVLPYSRASQSAAVLLAQALGSAVVASAVGGIPEQIEHDVTGWLVDPAAPVSAWKHALATLSDRSVRTRLGAAAATAAQAAHQRFVAALAELIP
jgi:glycosyltransferase involved in cell wall biosynthesis